MLKLNKLGEGACYFSEDTRIYTAWLMLCHSSRQFWNCETIKKLDQEQFFEGRPIQEVDQHGRYSTYVDLLQLFQSIESPVLDAFRIITCFENYFKAKLLLGNCVIHQMNLNICREKYPQFMTGNKKRRLLQRTTPIKIGDIKRAENHEKHSSKPITTLNKHTLPISIFLRESEYQEIISIDQKLFSILKKLNNERNTLHFLNIEYIASKLPFDDFVLIKNCVVAHIDKLIEKIEKNDKAHLEFGKMQVENFG